MVHTPNSFGLKMTIKSIEKVKCPTRYRRWWWWWWVGQWLGRWQKENKIISLIHSYTSPQKYVTKPKCSTMVVCKKKKKKNHVSEKHQAYLDYLCRLSRVKSVANVFLLGAYLGPFLTEYPFHVLGTKVNKEWSTINKMWDAQKL